MNSISKNAILKYQRYWAGLSGSLISAVIILFATSAAFALDSSDSSSLAPSSEFNDYIAEHPIDILTAILLGDDRYDQAKPKLPSIVRTEGGAFLSNLNHLHPILAFDTAAKDPDSANANIQRNRMFHVVLALYDSSAHEDGLDLLKSFNPVDIESSPTKAASSLAAWLNSNSHCIISDYARFILAQTYLEMLKDLPSKSPQKKQFTEKRRSYLSAIISGRQKLLSGMSKLASGRSDDE